MFMAGALGILTILIVKLLYPKVPLSLESVPPPRKPGNTGPERPGILGQRVEVEAVYDRGKGVKEQAQYPELQHVRSRQALRQAIVHSHGDDFLA